jgi:hypothetical protein
MWFNPSGLKSAPRPTSPSPLAKVVPVSKSRWNAYFGPEGRVSGAGTTIRNRAGCQIDIRICGITRPVRGKLLAC